MTLDSRIYVIDEAPVSELFVFCQTLLGEYDDGWRGPERQVSRDEQDKTWRAGESFVEPGNAWSMANKLGQGLPAILDISYRPGVPLRTPEQAASHTEDGYCNHPANDYFDANEPVCNETEHRPACWAEISLDTAYGYKDERGWGCGDLHAVLISRIGQWCDERGLRWSWKNEFTSDIHGGDDRYERLIDLTTGGFEASAWFRTTVMPALAAGLLDEDGER
jgi:hypothetical protein